MVVLNGYTNLGIVSTKKPFNAKLIWEHATYGLIMVDSTNQAVLLQSTKARLLVDGSDWTVIDLSDNTNSYKIQSGWLEGNDLWILMCDNDGTADDFEVSFIELDDSNDCNPIAVSAGADINTVYAYDIWIAGGNTYVINFEERAAVDTFVVWDVDTNPFVQNNTMGSNSNVMANYGALINGDTWYGISDREGDTEIDLVKWTIAGPGYAAVDTEPLGYSLPSLTQQGIAYDGSQFLYYILNKDVDGFDYLVRVDINEGPNEVVILGKYNISLMLNRQTASGVLEKAFHMTSTNIYQLHSAIPYQLHLIANPTSDAIWIAITDNFLMNDDGDLYERVDLSDNLLSARITYADMTEPSAAIELLNTVPIEEGMFIQLSDMFTTAGASAVDVIFEGYVTESTDRRIQKARLISPAQKDLDNSFPSGDFAGRTDEIIVLLLAAYADYITAGTMSNGMAMGTITFAGDKSLREIFDEFALQDNFTWYLTPIGIMLYNDGTVDTVENFTEASSIWDVDKQNGPRAINYVNIKGGFVDAVQVVGTPAENIPDQLDKGRQPFENTFAHLDLAAQCTTVNTNVLARLGTQALIVPMTHSDLTVGLMQVGQTVTTEYNVGDPIIPSTQIGIRGVVYDAVQGKGRYLLSDRLL